MIRAAGFVKEGNPTINGTIQGAVAIANRTPVNPQIYKVSGAAVLPLPFSISSFKLVPS